MKTLVVAAHPDDEVLGCGGTIARYSEQEEIYVAILGEGITSRFDDRSEAPQDELEELRRNSREAATILGVRDIRFFGLPDNRFDTVPLLDIIKIIRDLVEELRPRKVYTQHGGDLNVDHMRVYRAVLTATRPVFGNPVETVLAYEVGSSTEWAFQRFSPVFQPNYFVDISGTLEQKIRALECYESEIRGFPHPRSPKAQRAIATRWGSTAGCEAAEAFELVRSIRSIS